MISKEKLKEYAKIKGYNLGQAEKDYFQEIILSIIYNEFGKELVFKGGTALSKCYGFDRFSEDLDFNANTTSDFEKIISLGLKRHLLEFEIDSKEFKDAIKLIYRINGSLYNGQPTTKCKIVIDLSLREKIITQPNTKRIGLIIEEIPSFDVVAMAEEEIAAEKIRALITRNKARDIRKNIEIISAIREDREAVETAEVDIVFPGEMNYIMVRLAKKNQVAVGFDFHPLLHSSGKGRGRLLGDYLQTARLVRKYKAPFLLTSGAKSEWELRSPSELVAFGKVLGFSEADAKEALSGKILERNRKRLGKGWVMPGVEEK